MPITKEEAIEAIKVLKERGYKVKAFKTTFPQITPRLYIVGKDIETAPKDSDREAS